MRNDKLERGNLEAYAWYNRALRDGREIVITGDAPNVQLATAVWWYDNETDTVFSFNRHFGIMERKDTDIERLIRFAMMMEEECGTDVMVRGCYND